MALNSRIQHRIVYDYFIMYNFFTGTGYTAFFLIRAKKKTTTKKHEPPVLSGQIWKMTDQHFFLFLPESWVWHFK